MINTTPSRTQTTKPEGKIGRAKRGKCAKQGDGLRRKPKMVLVEQHARARNTVHWINKKIDEYFRKCEELEKPKTMSGLALALDMSREQILRYEHGKSRPKEGLCVVIKRAKDEIRAEWESRLASSSATGAIFWLKNNAGFSDRNDAEAFGFRPPVVIQVNFPNSATVPHQIAIDGKV